VFATRAPNLLPAIRETADFCGQYVPLVCRTNPNPCVASTGGVILVDQMGCRDTGDSLTLRSEEAIGSPFTSQASLLPGSEWATGYVGNVCALSADSRAAYDRSRFIRLEWEPMAGIMRDGRSGELSPLLSAGANGASGRMQIFLAAPIPLDLRQVKAIFRGRIRRTDRRSTVLARLSWAWW